MGVRLLIVAVAGLSLAGTVAAEPAKAPVRKAAQATEQPVEVVVATADQVRAPAPSGEAAAPVKRERRARVTTCRCGDQTANN